MDSKIPALDHLRALAITMVFLFHYRLFPHPAWLDAVSGFGWTGVDLFFVLSGYLIASQVFQKIQQGNFSLKKFFIKRFFRILPAYWFVLALYFVIPAFWEWESLPPLWKFLTFTQNFSLDLRYQRTFSHAWSLCVEEQYYFFFPLIVIALKYLKKISIGAAFILLLVVFGFTMRIISWNIFIAPVLNTDTFGINWYKWIYYPTYNRLDGLLAGISIAGIFQYKQDTKEFILKHSNIILFAGLALSVIAYYFCSEPQAYHASIAGFPLIACAYGLITASAVSPQSVLNKYTFYITSRTATLSYAIYLVHKGTIHVTQQQLGKYIPEDGSLMFVLSAAMSIVAAVILHYSIEKPFLKLRKSLLKKNNKSVNISTIQETSLQPLPAREDK